MGLRRGRWGGGSASKAVLLFWVVLCLVCACALISKSTYAESVCLEVRSSRRDSYTQGTAPARGRRELRAGGPGSYPPRCTSKCGTCTPCSPVHVPVPPGTPVTTEYYAEAWRCKCGNKLYMP